MDKELWVIQISLEGLAFYGRSVEPEELKLWGGLVVDEIYDLEYLHIDTDTMKETYFSYENTPELKKVEFKNINEILSQYEKPLSLSILHMTFTNGLILHYQMGELRFQIDNKDSFYEYSDKILREHEYIPANIYALCKHLPNKVLEVNPPGILTEAVEDKIKEVTYLQ